MTVLAPAIAFEVAVVVLQRLAEVLEDILPIHGSLGQLLSQKFGSHLSDSLHRALCNRFPTIYFQFLLQQLWEGEFKLFQEDVDWWHSLRHLGRVNLFLKHRLINLALSHHLGEGLAVGSEDVL